MSYTIAPLMLLSDVSPVLSAEYSVDGKPMTALEYRAYLNRNDKQFTLEVDYVCHEHQVFESRCPYHFSTRSVMPISYSNCDICHESYSNEELSSVESAYLGVAYEICPTCTLDSINAAESRSLYGDE